MKLIVPKYYLNFKCIGNKCSESCCEGWEIDIDDDSYNYYMSVGGKFGEILRNNIKDSPDGHSFKIKDGKRCAFLNDENLCDIFINCGEEHLCDVCTEHPRFYNWHDNYLEGGVGLDCEVAINFIISHINRTEYVEKETDFPENDFKDPEIYANDRKKILDYLYSDKKFDDKMRSIIDFGINIDNKYFFNSNENTEFNNIPENKNIEIQSKIISELSKLDAINPIWKNSLIFLANNFNNISSYENKFYQSYPEFDYILRNITEYYIWRYFYKGCLDGEVISYIKLSAICVFLIKNLLILKFYQKKKIKKRDIINICKLVSRQIEYSAENINSLFDFFDESDLFSSENFLKIF